VLVDALAGKFKVRDAGRPLEYQVTSATSRALSNTGFFFWEIHGIAELHRCTLSKASHRFWALPILDLKTQAPSVTGQLIMQLHLLFIGPFRFQALMTIGNIPMAHCK